MVISWYASDWNAFLFVKFVFSWSHIAHGVSERQLFRIQILCFVFEFKQKMVYADTVELDALIRDSLQTVGVPLIHVINAAGAHTLQFLTITQQQLQLLRQNQYLWNVTNSFQKFSDMKTNLTL